MPIKSIGVVLTPFRFARCESERAKGRHKNLPIKLLFLACFKGDFIYELKSIEYGGPEGSNTNKKENTNEKRKHKFKKESAQIKKTKTQIKKKENTNKRRKHKLKKQNTNYKKKTQINKRKNKLNKKQ